jgi:hypothetical protein
MRRMVWRRFEQEGIGRFQVGRHSRNCLRKGLLELRMSKSIKKQQGRMDGAVPDLSTRLREPFWE